LGGTGISQFGQGAVFLPGLRPVTGSLPSASIFAAFALASGVIAEVIRLSLKLIYLSFAA
jgi:hypothetical protein